MAEVIAELVGRLSFEIDDSGLKKFEGSLDDSKDGMEELEAETQKLRDKLDRAQKKAKETGGAFEGMNISTVALGTAIGTLGVEAVKSLASLAQSAISTSITLAEGFLESSVEMEKWSTSVGVGTEELQRLEFAARAVGGESEDMREGLTTLRENLGELDRLGTGPAVDALGTLGITLEEIKDLSATDQLKLFGKALNELPDDAQRLSVAMEVMGTEGRALMPLFREGAEGIDAYASAADKAGVVLSEQTIKKNAETARSIAIVKDQLEATGSTILSAFAPALIDISEKTQEYISQNSGLIEQKIPALLDDMAEAFEDVTEAVEFMIVAGEGIADVTSALVDFSDILMEIPGIGTLAALSIDAVSFAVDSLGNSISEIKRNNKQLDSGDDLIDLLGNDASQLAEISDKDFDKRIEGIIAGTRDESVRGSTDSLIGNLDRRRALGKERGAAADDASFADQFNAQTVAQFKKGEEGEVRAKRRAKFQKDELAKAKGGKGRKQTDTTEAEELFSDEVNALARVAGLGGKAVKASFEAAAKSLESGASDQVAREAAIGQLSSLSGLDLDVSSTPDAAVFGLLTQVGGPDAARSAAEGARFVRVENTVNVTNHFNVDVPDGFGQGLAGDVAGFDAATSAIFQDQWADVLDRFGQGVDA